MGTTTLRAGMFAIAFAVGVTVSGPVDAFTGQEFSKDNERQKPREEVFSLAVPISEDELEVVPERARTVVRRRFVAADPDDLLVGESETSKPLGRRRFRLDLFKGKAVDARLTRLIAHSRDRGKNAFTWFGYLPGREIGDVILTVVDGVMIGTVYVNERVYMLRPTAQRNAFELAQIDPRRLPPDHEIEDSPSGSLGDVDASRRTRRNRFRTNTALVSPARTFRNRGGLLEPVKVSSVASGLTFKQDSGDRIDLLVAYTQKAEQKASQLAGVGNIDLLIAHAVDKANWILMVSGVPTQLNVVKKLRVEGAEPTTELINSIKSGGIYHAQTLAAADQYRADIVSLFIGGTATNAACGQGEILNDLTVPEDQTFPNGRGQFSAFGRNWVKVECAVDDTALMHEVGHNAGLMHDHYSLPPGRQGATSFGFGFVMVPSRRMTVMAYDGLCDDYLGESCYRLPRFSDPLASYKGWIMGTFGGPLYPPANNVQAFIEALPTVTNFRPSAFPPP